MWRTFAGCLIVFSSIGFAADTPKTDSFSTEKGGASINWKVYAPSGYDENCVWPALILTVAADCGHVEQDAWPLFAQAGYFVAIMEKFPNGIKDDAFVDSISAAPAQLGSKYKLDTTRIYTLGFSVHGNQAMYMACKKPDIFAGAISICHFFPGPVPSAKQVGRAMSFLVISGDKDYNYPSLKRKEILVPYEKAGHDIEFKDVPGLEHFFHKSEVPLEIEWLNSHGVVKDYPAQLAAARDFEKRQQFQQAGEIYKKLADSRRSHPAVAAALERMRDIQQVQAAALVKKNQEREDAALKALAQARELREQKKWGLAQAAFKKLNEFAGTAAAKSAAEELAAMLADPIVQKSFADDAAERQCRSLLGMAGNYIKGGMNDEARTALNKVIETCPNSVMASDAKKLLENLK